ncbi:MAG: glycosyltransferase [Verrucomicrobiota bacterium]
MSTKGLPQRATYVGILTEGTTSRMRAEVLRQLTPDWIWTWINTHPPYNDAAKWKRTLAMRFKKGPVLSETNRLVCSSLPSVKQNFIWVDKASYLTPATTQQMRTAAETLIHYTPDTAFHTNRFKGFNESLHYYDWAITTKSFEHDAYGAFIPKERLIATTQAYDSNLHSPRAGFAEKKADVIFIGLCEPDRETCASILVKAGLNIRIGGMGWDRFCAAHQAHENFEFIGNKVFGEDYSAEISNARFGLGLLSRRFPELHTTRTFEIPACGTVLATERNAETANYFSDDEALFVDDYAALPEKMNFLLQNPAKLEAMTAAGTQRVQRDGRDYETVLKKLLIQTGIFTS